MKKRIIAIALVVTIFLLLASGCAGPNTAVGTPDGEGKIAGFWTGLLHGLISFVTFIISLFKDGVNVYEVHNNGNWYNFGFILGAMIIFSGSGGGAKSIRKRNK